MLTTSRSATPGQGRGDRVMTDKLLLTDEEIAKALAGLWDKGTEYCCKVIMGYQLLKAKPLIEKQERERIINLINKRLISCDGRSAAIPFRMLDALVKDI